MATNYSSCKIDEIKLAVAMAKKKMNAKQLAEVSGASRQTISYIRSGKRCTVDVLAKIAVALGIEPNELLED